MSTTPAYRRLLVATDFSATGRAAEEHALGLAERLGASCLLLHVIEAIDGDDEDISNFYKSLEERAQTQFEPVLKRFANAGVECQARTAVGQRWQKIVEVAESEGFDLIAVGSRSLSGDRPSFGTTSHRVFFATHVPLLVVRTED